jgi:type I restriction enzyme R subunit
MWNVMTQIREEACFTKGRVIVRGKTVKRGEAKKADYDYDAFDLVCHVAFDAPPLTRKERAVFAGYGAQARAVLEALLQKYADAGIASVESLEILKVDPLASFGTPLEIVKLFGGKPGYMAAITDLESVLYENVA